MQAKQTGLIGFLRSDVLQPRPYTLVFIASMVLFAAMVIGGFAYYAAEYKGLPDLNFGPTKQANQMLRDGQHDAAAREYEIAAAIWPTETPLVYNKGANELEAGRIDQAINTWEEFLRIKPDEPNTHFALGTAYGRKGDYKAAIEHFARSLEKGPVAYVHLGDAYDAVGMYMQAADAYARALEMAPDYPQAQEKFARANRLAMRAN